MVCVHVPVCTYVYVHVCVFICDLRKEFFMCKIYHKELAHVIMEDGKFKVCSVGQQVKFEGHWQNSPLLRRLAF